MIWTRGELLPDDALRVSVLDQTFEHGLGLFETLRTWNGHPTLLGRHLERLRRSARSLGLPLESDQLPDARAVTAIADTSRFAPGEDVRIRITLSGGLATGGGDSHRSVLWMAAGPLPPPSWARSAIIEESILVDPADPLARHKTLNHWRRRIEYSRAVESGADEVLCLTPDGTVCEACRFNIFLVEGQCLLTPGIDGPLLAGIMRRVVLDRARRLGLEVSERRVSRESLAGADEAFLTNAVRGMLPIARLLNVDLPAPGHLTSRLWSDVVAWLEGGGMEP
jgi:branched-subunit amino acid aminotransferase/4-amino-4-deoxychorismate lyase